MFKHYQHNSIFIFLTSNKQMLHSP